MSINALTNPVIPQYQAEPSVVLIKPEEFRSETSIETELELAVDSSDLTNAEATETSSYSPANGLSANGLTVNGLGVNALGVNSLGINALGVNSLGINALGVNSLGLNGLTANGLELNDLKTTTAVNDAAAAAIGGALGAILEEPQAPSPIGPGGIGSLNNSSDTFTASSSTISEVPLEAITVFTKSSNKPAFVAFGTANDEPIQVQNSSVVDI